MNNHQPLFLSGLTALFKRSIVVLVALAGMLIVSVVATTAEASAAPVVSSVAPAVGSASGGDTVTITGTGFDDGAAVKFGQTLSPSVTFIDSTTLLAVAPPNLVQNATVTVVNNDAQESSLKEAYLYQVTNMTLTGITPNQGALAGNTSVTLSGTNMQTRVASTAVTGSTSNKCLLADGSVYCWGNNVGGYVGIGYASEKVATPTRIDGLLAGKTVTDVSVGGSSTCAIADGEAYCWGYGIYGQIGNGTTSAQMAPVKVTQAAGILAGKTVTNISVGTYHTCAIADGEAYCWGRNNEGQVGYNNTTDQSSPVKVTQTSGNLLGKTVTSISVGDRFTCAVASGETYCWGYNGFGQLGDNTVTQKLVPTKVVQQSGVLLSRVVTEVAAGNEHTCAIADGEAYCWGYNNNGQLGDATSGDKRVPTRVTQAAGVLQGKAVSSIVTGASYTCALANGEVYCWGSDNVGQTGYGSIASSRTSPVKTIHESGGLLGRSISKLVTAGNSTCAIADELPFCWGQNSSNELVIGNTSNQTKPVLSDANILAPEQATFGDSSVAVLSSTATSLSTKTPARSAGTVDVSVSSTYFASKTLANAYEYREAPTVSTVAPSHGSVSGGDTVTVRGTGFDDGAAVKFGQALSPSVTFIDSTTLLAVAPPNLVQNATVTVVNNDSQNGDLKRAYLYQVTNMTLNGIAPTQGALGGNTSVTISGTNMQTRVASTAVTGSTSNKCLLADGSVYCWGNNSNGNVGVGYISEKVTTPTKIGGLLAGKTVTDVSSNSSFTCAIADGEAYCWGVNSSGYLGNGTNTDSATPVKVTQAAGVLAGKTVSNISVGNLHACAVAGGEVYCWGYNFYGALGDNTTVNKSTPTKVAQTSGNLLDKTVTSLSVGNRFTCAVANGEVYCWGLNTSGQLGDNTITQKLVPTKVIQQSSGLLAKIAAKVTTGDQHACAIADTETYCWGYNGQGQLGDNTTTERRYPVKVTQTAGALQGKTVTDITTGSNHTCVLASGETYCWGSDNVGQVGYGSIASSRTTPVKTIQETGVLLGRSITGLTGAGNDTCAIADELPFCWGQNTGYELAITSTANQTKPALSNAGLLAPEQVTFGDNSVAVLSSTATSLSTKTPARSAGTVDVSASSTYFASKTLTSAYEYRPAPSVTAVSPSVGTIAGGDTVTITGTGFDSDVTVTFGGKTAPNVTYIDSTTLVVTTPPNLAQTADVVVTNHDTQAATLARSFLYRVTDYAATSVSPNKGALAGGTKVTLNGENLQTQAKVSMSGTTGRSSCSLVDGSVYCWGNNDSGQLGSTTPSITSQTQVKVGGVLANKIVTKLSQSDSASHMCAIADGEAYCWGYGPQGQLGNGVNASSASPVKVTQAAGILAGKTVTDISVGLYTSCAVADGEAYCWGYNSEGTLGNNTTTSQPNPVKVTQTSGNLLGKTVTSISLGYSFACVAASGEVYCWGRNTYGQLGDMSTSQKNVPSKAYQGGSDLYLKTVTKVATGNQHTCAVADGGTYCWGYNGYGQMGDNSTNNRSYPVKVVQATGILLGKTVTDITAGDNHTCALANGEAFCWGYGGLGQLGSGSTGSLYVPTPVTKSASALTDKTLTHIAAGDEHTCAIADEKQYCWGSNSYGELGSGTVGNQSVPVKSHGGLLSPTNVTFDGLESTVGQGSSTNLDVTTPAHAAATVDVTTSSTYFAPKTLAAAYEYREAPSLTSVSPSVGSTSGGDMVTITGNYFDPGSRVTFRGIEAASVTYINSTTLQVVTPANFVGSHDVVVINEDNQQVSLARAFYAQLPAPTVTALNPSGGSPEGGNEVSIEGSGFEGSLAVEAVALGDYHKCILANGEVYCSGNNGNGRLGDGTTVNKTTPTKVDMSGALAGKVVTKITAGGSHTCAIASGEAYCWGNNGNGQLGIGSYAASISPVKVGGLLAGKTVTSVSAGGTHTCATADNETYCWGANSQGQLGDGTTTQKTTPVKVPQINGVLLGKTATDVSAGSSFSCVIASGEAYCWGYNAFGQIGNGSSGVVSTPYKVASALINKTVTSISAGTNHTCVAADSEAYCWGYNGYGQVGDNTYNNRPYPAKVAQLAGILAGKAIQTIDAGTQQTCAIADESVYCWGLNSYGILGDASSTGRTLPVKVITTDMSQPVTNIAVDSGNATCAVSGYYEYCWGTNAHNQFGIGEPTLVSNTPLKTQTGEVGVTSVLFDGTTANITSRDPTVMKVTAPAHAPGAVDVSMSGDYIQPQIVANGYLYAEPPTISAISPTSGSTAGGDLVTVTGTNFVEGSVVKFDGVVASTTYVNATTLTALAPPGTMGKVMVVVMTPDQQKAKVADGYEYTGGTVVGFVGINPSQGPVAGGQSAIITGTGFSGRQSAGAIATSGNYTTCGILNGEAYCWGNNSNSQLGDGGTTNKLTPNKVTQDLGLLAGKTVTDIEPGNLHSCAVADNEAYCWGYNGQGQIGNSSTANASVPVRVSGLLAGKVVTKISSGTTHTCAIASGEAYCWGSGSSGKLGNNATGNSTAPTKVSQSAGLLSSKTVTDISAGTEHTCAIADGEAYCWGSATYGALGNNSSATSLVPVKVSQLANGLADRTITDISAGQYSTCVVASGEVYCWGYNNYGQLGDGTTTNRSTPTKVIQSQNIMASKTASRVSVETGHSCAIADNAAYCWGYNAQRQLGEATDASISSIPVPVKGNGTLEDRSLSDIAVGPVQSCAIASKSIYCWGGNNNGVFGNGTTTNSVLPTATTLTTSSWQIEAKIGSVTAPVTARSGSTITVTTPPHTAGLKDVELTRVEDNSTATGTNTYEYLAAPTATAINPALGSMVGGDTVTITGQDFKAGATVKFGSLSATNIQFISSTEIRATVPAAANDGTVNVTVANPDGQSSTLTGAFTYTPPLPSVTSISQRYSKMSGGQTVTLTGTNFSAAMTPTVKFGNLTAATTTVVNNTQVNVTVPASTSLGTVSVTYTDKYGQTAQLTDAFTYLPQSYAFTNDPLVVSATEPGMLVVQARDTSGQPIVATEDITLTVSSTSTNGFFARDINSGETNPWQYDTILIKAGSSLAEFYYKDNTKGTPTLAAKDGANTTTFQGATIGSRYKLQVTGVSDPVQSGVPSSVTVRAVNFEGQPEPSYTGTFSFRSTDSAALLPSTFTMTAAMKGVHTFVNGVTMVTPGEWCVSATDTSEATVTGDQCGIDVSAPNAGSVSRLKIITPAQHIEADGISTPITVQGQDINGIPASVGSDTTLYLTSNSATGQFSTTGTGGWSSAMPFAVTLKAGTTASSVYYRDTGLGTHQLLAADRSTDTFETDFAWTNDTQAITTGVGQAAQFGISGTNTLTVNQQGEYTVILQDSQGNTVTANENVSVLINDPNTTTDIASGASGQPAQKPVLVTIPAGSSQTTFYATVRAPGATTVTATDARGIDDPDSFTAATIALNVSAAEPFGVRVTAPSTAQVNTNTAMSAQLVDVYGNITPATSNTTVSLSSSAPTGSFLTADGNTPLTSVSLTSGASSVSFMYRDTNTGERTITAASTGLEAAEAQISVVAGPYAALGFTQTETLRAGESKQYSFELKDESGFVAATTSDTDIALSAGEGSDFSVDGVTWGTRSITVPAGETNGTFYYRSTKAGTDVIHLRDATNDINASRAQIITAAAPTTLNFTSNPQVIVKNASSSALSVSFADAYGNEATADGTSVLTFTDNSQSGEFSKDGQTWSSTLTFTAEEDALSAEVYYRNSAAGMWNLSVVAPNYTGASQSIETVDGFAQKVVLTASAETVEAGEPIAVTLETQTNDGLAVPVRTDTMFSLTATDGEFSETDTSFTPTESTTLSSGQSQKTLFYRSSTMGTKNLSANSTSLTDGSESIQITPSNIFKFVMTPQSSSIDLATDSAPFTVTTQDVYGNISPVTEPTNAFLFSSSATGEFKTNATTSSQLTLQTGASAGQFTYSDNTFQTQNSLLTVSDKQALDEPDIDIVNATASVAIRSQAVDRLQFTTPARTVVAGQKTESIRVSLLQTDGSPALQDGTTSVSFEAPDGGQFFASSDATEPTTSITVPRGSSEVEVFFSHTTSGAVPIVANLGLKVAAQSVMIKADEAKSIRFVSAPQIQNADVASEQIIVKYYDQYLNEATLTSERGFDLTSSCLSGRFSESTSPWQDTSRIMAGDGSDQLVFYYQASVKGMCNLTVTGDGLGSASQQFEVDHALAASIHITNPSQTISVGQQAQVAYELRDVYGNVVPLTEQKTFYLGSSSTTSVITPSSRTLYPGQSGGSFTYTDDKTGTPSLTLRDQASSTDGAATLTDASTQFTVVQGDFAQLGLTSSGSGRAGERQAITLTPQNAYGATRPTGEETTIDLSSTGNGVFTSDADGNDIITQAQLAPSDSSVTVYYSQTAAQQITISAKDSTNANINGSLVTSFVGANVARIAFVSPSPAVMIGAYQRLNVQLLDIYGNITTTSAPLKLYTSSTSMTGQFYSSPSESSRVSEFTLGAGVTSGGVYYKDTVIGANTVTVRDETTTDSDTGLTNATQNVTMVYGEPHHIDVNQTGFTVARGEVYGPVTATLKNAAGMTIPAPYDMPVSVSGTAGGSEYALAANDSWSNSGAFTLSTGQSALNFYYRTLTASQDSRYELRVSAVFDGVTRTHTTRYSVVYGAPSHLSFVTPERSMDAQHPSSVMTAELRNGYGAAIPTQSDRNIYLRTTSSTGEFTQNLAGTWGTNYVVMSEDTSKVNFYYRDRSAGTPTITAADNIPVLPDSGLINATQQATVNEQVFDHFYVANISDPQQAGIPSSVVVVAQDAEDYTVESYAGVITFSSDDPTAVLPPPYTFNPDRDKGSHTFTNAVTFKTSGEKIVTVTDENRKTGQQRDITVGPPNTNPVRSLAIIAPDSPYSLMRNQTSDEITVQLRDVDGAGTVAPGGGYPVRLSSSSPTGELSLQPNGPWQSTLTTSISEGVSSQNVYYRDSQLGSYTLTAHDWIDGVDNAVIGNGELLITIDEFEVEGNADIFSTSARGAEVKNKYLFAHNESGEILGRVSAQFTSLNMRNQEPFVSNWQLSWKRAGATLDRFTQQNTSTVPYAVGPLTTTSGDADYEMSAEAQSSGSNITRSATIQVPVSPWTVNATAESTATSNQRTTLRADISQTRSDNALTSVRFSVYDIATGGQVYSADNARSVAGELVRTLAPSTLPEGRYELLTQLFDNDGAVLAEDMSEAFTVGPIELVPPTEIEPNPETPSEQPPLVVAPTQTPPSAPTEDSATTPPTESTSNPVQPRRPVSVAESTTQPQGALQVIAKVIKDVAASPYTPIVVPGLFIAGLFAFMALISAQILRQIRYSNQLKLILAHERETAKEKTQFINLVAHHLRTPVTIISAAIDLLATRPESAAYAAVVKPLAGELSTVANSIVETVDQNVSAPSSGEFSEDSAKIYRLPSFWLSAAIGIGVLVAVNMFVTIVGAQDVNAYTIAGQLLSVAIALSVLYFVLQERSNRKRLSARLDEARKHRDELDNAKNQAIQLVAAQLTTKIATLQQRAQPVMSTGALGAAQLADGIKQLSKIVHSIETLSTINSAHVVKETINMRELIASSVIERLQTFKDKHVTIEPVIQSATIASDVTLLKTVTESILDNAVAYSPEGGHVGFTSIQTPEGAQITITDEGPGLPKEVTEQLLQPFTHPGDEMADAHQGLGLSLYLDALIMRHLGGRLDFMRSNGRTSIVLSLPQ